MHSKKSYADNYHTQKTYIQSQYYHNKLINYIFSKLLPLTFTSRIILLTPHQNKIISMNYETAKKVYNCIQQCTSSYTVNDLYKVQFELENIAFTKKYENIFFVSMIVFVLGGFGLSSLDWLTVIQKNTILSVSIPAGIVCGVALLVAFMVRANKISRVETMIYSLKKLIETKRIEKLNKDEVIKSAINAWVRHLLRNNITDNQIASFQHYLEENLRSDFVEDPHEVLTHECLFLRLAAKHANIQMDVFYPTNLNPTLSNTALHAEVA